MKASAIAALLVIGVPAMAMADASKIALPHEKYRLPNGLEVILAVDRKLPVVAVNVWYHVGAAHEQSGRTGYAHLMEHLMFQGSKHVADDVHIGLLEELGARDLNGTTSFDRTNYFQTVPSHHLAVALWLESDRMGFLAEALTAKKLEEQKDVVRSEREQGVETAPYGVAREKAWHRLFLLGHPYRGDVLGSPKDLNAATVADVRAFVQQWYAPANATLAIVGDFDPDEAKALVEKYFASLPSGPKPAWPEITPRRLQEASVVRHEEQVAREPLLSCQWLTPAYFEPGDATADVLATVLATGQASRLHRRLVLEKQLAQRVTASQSSNGAQSVFTLEAIGRPGISTDTLLREVDAVLEEVGREGLTAREVERARTLYETRMLAGLQSVGGFGGKADVLQNYNHFLGEPDGLARDLARYQAVTPEAVKRFVRETLRPNARVILHAVPRNAEGN